MKVNIMSLVVSVALLCSSQVKAQTYDQGFKEGMENAEYIMAYVLAQNPGWGIVYDFHWHQININKPGGIEPDALPDTASHSNALLVLNVVDDPSAMITALFSDENVVAFRQYHFSNWEANPTPYNYGIICGVDARLSGKYGR